MVGAGSNGCWRKSSRYQRRSQRVVVEFLGQTAVGIALGQGPIHGLDSRLIPVLAIEPLPLFDALPRLQQIPGRVDVHVDLVTGVAAAIVAVEGLVADQVAGVDVAEQRPRLADLGSEHKVELIETPPAPQFVARLFVQEVLEASRLRRDRHVDRLPGILQLIALPRLPHVRVPAALQVQGQGFIRFADEQRFDAVVIDLDPVLHQLCDRRRRRARIVQEDLQRHGVLDSRRQLAAAYAVLRRHRTVAEVKPGRACPGVRVEVIRRGSTPDGAIDGRESSWRRTETHPAEAPARDGSPACRLRA